MGQRLIISEQERRQINNMYGLINEQGDKPKFDINSVLRGFLWDMDEKVGDELWKKGDTPDMDYLAAHKELGIYYEDLRDGKTPRRLSNRGEAHRRAFEKMIEDKNPSGALMRKMEQKGKNIKTDRYN